MFRFSQRFDVFEMRFGSGLSCVKFVKQRPLLDNTPCAIQSLDNMSIDPVCDDGDDDDDDGDDDDDDDVDDQQEVELKVSFQMIPNGMQHLSLPNGHCHHFRRKSTTISSKNPPCALLGWILKNSAK